jgi:hypothetical protein
MMNFLFSLIEQPLIWLSHRQARSNRQDNSRPSVGLGTNLDTGEGFDLTPKDLARHAYLLGSTGCGKTTAILKLIEADLRSDHSFVVVDLRGDLVAGAVGVCAQLDIAPSRITLLDLRDPNCQTGFNPLCGAGEPHIRALHVLDVIAQEAESWGVQLEETLRSALLLLATAGEPLTKLESLFYNRPFRSACLGKTTDESLTGFWARYDHMNPDRQQSWALPVLNKVTSLLAVSTLRTILSGENDLALGNLLNTKGHIFLVALAVDELHRSSRMLGSLIVSAISREMMARVNVPERNRNPVRLYVDEFENMASESFEGLIAEGRRFGLTLVLSHQTLSQLPIKLRSIIRNNVGLQILFQCGFEDASHVARELPDGIEAASIRELEPGQAYLMKRDGTADLIQFSPPKKAAAAKHSKAYRTSILNDGVQESSNAQSVEQSESTPDTLPLSLSMPPEDLL